MYAMGNAQALYDIFVAIDHFVQSSLFQSISTLIAISGAVFIALKEGATPAVGRKFVGYAILVMIFSYVFFGWGGQGRLTVNLIIADTENGTYLTGLKVPAAIGIPASFITTTGQELTKAIENTFPIGAGLKMSNGAPFNLAASMMGDAAKARIVDADFNNSLYYYMQDCVTFGVATGNINVAQVMVSGDLMKTIKYDNNAVMVMSFISGPGDETSSTKPAGLGSYGEVTGCLDAWKRLSQWINAADTYDLLTDVSSFSSTPALSLFNAKFDAVGDHLSSTGNHAGYIKQSALVNTYNGGQSTVAAATGNSEFLTQIGLAQAKTSQYNSWVTGAEIFNRMMGYTLAIIQAFIFGVMPIVLLGSLIPSLGTKLFFNFCQILLWLAIVHPMLAIVNFIILSMQTADLGGLFGVAVGNGTSDFGISLSSIGVISEKTANMRAAGSFIGTMVPALAWALVKGSLDFSKVIGSAVGEQFANQAAGVGTTGSYNLNTATSDTFSANKKSIAATSAYTQHSVNGGVMGQLHDTGSTNDTNITNNSNVNQQSSAGVAASTAATSGVNLAGTTGVTTADTIGNTTAATGGKTATGTTQVNDTTNASVGGDPARAATALITGKKPGPDGSNGGASLMDTITNATKGAAPGSAAAGIAAEQKNLAAAVTSGDATAMMESAGKIQNLAQAAAAGAPSANDSKDKDTQKTPMKTLWQGIASRAGAVAGEIKTQLGASSTESSSTAVARAAAVTTAATVGTSATGTGGVTGGAQLGRNASTGSNAATNSTMSIARRSQLARLNSIMGARADHDNMGGFTRNDYKFQNAFGGDYGDKATALFKQQDNVTQGAAAMAELANTGIDATAKETDAKTALIRQNAVATAIKAAGALQKADKDINDHTLTGGVLTAMANVFDVNKNQTLSEGQFDALNKAGTDPKQIAQAMRTERKEGETMVPTEKSRGVMERAADTLRAAGQKLNAAAVGGDTTFLNLAGEAATKLGNMLAPAAVPASQTASAAGTEAAVKPPGKGGAGVSDTSIIGAMLAGGPGNNAAQGVVDAYRNQVPQDPATPPTSSVTPAPAGSNNTPNVLPTPAIKPTEPTGSKAQIAATDKAADAAVKGGATPKELKTLRAATTAEMKAENGGKSPDKAAVDARMQQETAQAKTRSEAQKKSEKQNGQPTVDQKQLDKAVQRQESGGETNPNNAVSLKGARGAMQLLPATAMNPGYGAPSVFDIAKKQGVPFSGKTEEESKRLLANGDVNKELGSAYLAAMVKTNGGNVAVGLAAYNQGPGAVKGAASFNGLSNETKNYVAGVAGQYFKATGNELFPGASGNAANIREAAANHFNAGVSSANAGGGKDKPALLASAGGTTSDGGPGFIVTGAPAIGAYKADFDATNALMSNVKPLMPDASANTPAYGNAQANGAATGVGSIAPASGNAQANAQTNATPTPEQKAMEQLPSQSPAVPQANLTLAAAGAGMGGTIETGSVLASDLIGRAPDGIMAQLQSHLGNMGTLDGQKHAADFANTVLAVSGNYDTTTQAEMTGLANQVLAATRPQEKS